MKKEALTAGRQSWIHVSAVERHQPDTARVAAFAIDSPRTGEAYRGAGLEINGWVIGRDTPVRAVRIVRDGAPGPAAPLDVRRPDVAAEHPAFPHAGASGFSIWAPLDLDDEAARVSLEAVLESGETAALATIATRTVFTAIDSRPPVTGPDFVVIGAQRGGTTSLHAYLGGHPRIALPATKELHYLTDRFARGREWYLGQFPAAIPPDGLTGEATPYALFHPLAPDRLRATAPDAKLIVLLRNPVDRAYSHYLMAHARGDEPLDFAAALDSEADRMAGEEERLRSDPTYVSWPHKQFSYLARGDYAPQLARWFARFPRDQFLILRSEDLYADPAATYGRVLDFLELEPAGSSSFAVHNRTDGPFLASRLRDRLAAHFAPKNAGLADLLGWDPGWT